MAERGASSQSVISGNAVRSAQCSSNFEPDPDTGGIQRLGREPTERFGQQAAQGRAAGSAAAHFAKPTQAAAGRDRVRSSESDM